MFSSENTDWPAAKSFPIWRDSLRFLNAALFALRHFYFNDIMFQHFVAISSEEKFDVHNDPNYIISGPCRGCNKVFQKIRTHLRFNPFCSSIYDMEELRKAATERH